MKKQKLMLFCSVFVLSFLGLAFLTNQSAFAATKTWDGSSNNNFNTAANWSGDSVPQDGDDIVLPYDVIFASSCADDMTLNNDLSGVSFASISGTGDRPADCYENIVIDGNEVEVTGNILGNDASSQTPQIRFMVDVAITDNVTLGAVYGYEDLSIGSNNVTLISSSFAGGVSGSGDIELDEYDLAGGSGGGCSTTATPHPFGGTSSGFSGAITVIDGSMVVTKRSGDIARYASSITKEADGLLYFKLDNGENLSLATDITLKGGGVTAYQLTNADCDRAKSRKNVSLTGDITVTADTEFNLSRTNIIFDGSLSGASKVKLPAGEDGEVTLPNGNVLTSKLDSNTVSGSDDCYQYIWWAYNKRTYMNKDCSDELATTEVYGIAGGTGTLGTVTIKHGGTIAPGTSPGVLTTGDLEFEEGGIYDFEMAGTKAGDYDQIKVNGTVTLGDGTLNVDAIDGFTPKVGNKFTIINNNGSDAVDGRFDGLAQGAVFTDDGIQFRISYTGGSGNDVVLTVLAIVGAPDTGSARFTNNPLAIILVTIACSGAIAYIATRYNKGAHAA